MVKLLKLTTPSMKAEGALHPEFLANGLLDALPKCRTKAVGCLCNDAGIQDKPHPQKYQPADWPAGRTLPMNEFEADLSLSVTAKRVNCTFFIFVSVVFASPLPKTEKSSRLLLDHSVEVSSQLKESNYLSCTGYLCNVTCCIIFYPNVDKVNFISLPDTLLICNKFRSLAMNDT